ncbi:solute carrier family 35 member C2-like [Paramacrobiotus metropolitanus]|uniref:solute carrier family 35 member C2-like n=1 Tax=Paramacrobiotus metropolitanus TaxID=2943436 RepID=UPI0024457058|nr:solute carrier family 35 member C2-like [Paramacrobiotus metropolitanus]
MVQKRMLAYARKRRDKLVKTFRNLFGSCNTSTPVGITLTVMPSKAKSLHDPLRRLSVTTSAVDDLRREGIFSKWFLIYAIKTVLLILLYYIFSIGLTFYQKKFIQIFEFPLSIVTGHFAIKFVLAALVRGLWCLSSGAKRPCMPCGTFITRMGPPGVAAALDIGLSNWSLVFITISLYTMTKSSTIVFILIFALVLRLEKFKWSLLGVVILISCGLFLFTFESTQFNLFGFSLVMGASVLSGIRWTLSQVLTQKKDYNLSNPIDMIFHIQPWMFLSLLPFAVIFEGKTVLEAQAFHNRDETIRTLLLTAGGGVAGFLMEVSEYVLLTHTSSITLSVSGITKEILQFALAYQYNGDKISPMNFVGLVICMGGVVFHVVLKLIDQNRKLAHLDAVINSHTMENDVANTAVTAALLTTTYEQDEWDGLEEIDLNDAVASRPAGHGGQ